MRQRLQQLLRCPACASALDTTPFVESSDGEVVDGLLVCSCGLSYPVVDTIPRMLSDAWELFPEFVERYRNRLGRPARTDGTSPTKISRVSERTRQSFGYQWTTFSAMVCDFRENFWNYLAPATPEFFRGRLGLDAGCGFGRHIYHAASSGAEMVGVDFSQAIDATRQNTKHLPNVHLVQADIYRLPFARETFDFIYSIGVLHHLPDPGRGLRSLSSLLKVDGTLFVWLYSSKRKILNAMLETARRVTTWMPHRLVQALSWLGAVIDWVGFVLPYRALRSVPGFKALCERWTPARVKLYSRYPFQVLYADWFDRLAAPVRFYYDEQGVRALTRAAGLSGVEVTPTGLYGWRACGVKEADGSAAAEKGRNKQEYHFAA